MMKPFHFFNASCLVSPDRKYRFYSKREWLNTESTQPGYVVFVGLNPPLIKDESKEDQSILQQVKFANHWGYSRMASINLFAYRTSSYSSLRSCPDPSGPKQYYDDVVRIVHGANELVLCWGNPGLHQGRSTDFLSWIQEEDMVDKCVVLGVTPRKQPLPLFTVSLHQPRQHIRICSSGGVVPTKIVTPTVFDPEEEEDDVPEPEVEEKKPIQHVFVLRHDKRNISKALVFKKYKVLKEFPRSLRIRDNLQIRTLYHKRKSTSRRLFYSEEEVADYLKNYLPKLLEYIDLQYKRHAKLLRLPPKRLLSAVTKVISS